MKDVYAKLTPQLRDAVCEAVERGHTYRAAAAAAKIAESTLHNWMRQGREDRAKGDHGTVHAGFLAAVEMARDRAQYNLLECVVKAGRKGTWQAACWVLERRWPDQYGSDRREIRELNRQVAELQKLVADMAGQAQGKKKPAK